MIDQKLLSLLKVEEREKLYEGGTAAIRNSVRREPAYQGA